MNFVRLVSMIVALLFFSFVVGLWPGQQPAVEENSLWFGIILFAAFAFVLFRTRIWGDTSQSGGRPMTVVHRTTRTPSDVMRDVTIARLQMIIVFALIAFILIEYFGYHDVLMQVLDWIAAKGERLVNALLE
ncbi:MAG: hypothetical protein HZB51_17550 [Chloroflexi bacterium]|nr:hypothetical protein [Chloroflexota bacterium]